MYEDLIKGSDEVTIDLLPGIKGKVLVVDPKWNFVVVDVGEKKQGAVNGVLLISRNGRLVGKEKIVSITADRSIANVLPGWKLDELMEGDDVLN